MKDTLFVLASASPRRKELLKQIGIDFEICVSECDESKDTHSASDLVVNLARKKADAVFHKLYGKDTDIELKEKLKKAGRVIIIAADTVVSLDGKILGKPGDEKEARLMLSELSGRKNEVFTGVCLLMAENKEKAVPEIKLSEEFFEKTEVYFNKLSNEDIDEYISTGEPMDKAGAYGIQGFAARYISKINGDYNNVVGLPLSKLWYTVKNKFGE